MAKTRKERLVGEAKARALKKAGAYQRLFGTPDGMVVLNDLRETFGGKLHVPGDPHGTSVRVGEFGVLQYIDEVMEVDTDE